MALSGKVIVVTGASAGIGEEVARQAIAQGGSVVLAARSGEILRKMAAELGESALAVETDVTKRSDHERLLQQAVERFGHVDVWINNAGRGITRSIFDATDADFDEMMLVNTKSALYGMQTVIGHFKERRQGHIINVSSLLGRIAYVSFRSIYCAAKHALNSITLSARLEVKQLGLSDVHVSCVMPGVVGTKFGLSALHGGPDNRKLPGAQPVEEAAEIIMDLIKNPRAEVYTRASYKDWMAKYFSADRVEELEAQPPFNSEQPK